MIDPARLADGILAGPLPQEPHIAALPMYDWPEARGETDAQWAAIRDELRKRGVDAPESLTRRNADLLPVPGGVKDGSGKVIAPDPASLPPDELDLAVLWQHPNLLLSQTCWGPLELWLKGVRLVGQEDYSGVEGGEGEMYSSAALMRRGEALKVRSEAPPPLTPPHKGEGEKRGSQEPFRLVARGRGASLHNLLSGLRLAFNAPDSLSGLLALQRDLEAQGSGLHIFSALFETGGHRASIRAVAEGRADVAAIDAKTWGLAQRFEPAARELAVVGWTGRRKGLPFVTAASR
jgi:ABC-type phosphate/phosphonate transport system substrate-binding protein